MFKKNKGVFETICEGLSRINSFSLDKPVLKMVFRYGISSMIGVEMFIALSLYNIRPFNYFLIGLAICTALLTILYVILFGSFVFNIYQSIMVLFLTTQFISFVATGFRTVSFTPLLLGLFGMCMSEFYSQKDIPKKYILLLFGMAGLAFEILFFVVEFNGIVHPNFSNRIGEFFGNQNDVGRNLAVVCLLTFGIIIDKAVKHRIKYALAIPSLFAFYLILLTGSISNIITVFLVIFVFLFVRVPKRKLWIVLVTLVALVSLVIISIQLPYFKYFKNRIEGMFSAFGYGNSRVDGSFISRLGVALNGLILFLESPLVGNGFRAISLFSSIGTTHNNFTDILSEFGVVSLFAYELLILVPIISHFRKKAYSQNYDSVFILLLYTFLFQLFLYSYTFKMDMMIIPFGYLVFDVNIDFVKLLKDNYKYFIFNNKHLFSYYYELDI